jgi:hypothetical protein
LQWTLTTIVNRELRDQGRQAARPGRPQHGIAFEVTHSQGKSLQDFTPWKLPAMFSPTPVFEDQFSSLGFWTGAARVDSVAIAGQECRSCANLNELFDFAGMLNPAACDGRMD